MTTKNNIEKVLSKRKSNWIKKAKFRIENKKWLNYSAQIAVRIHAIIERDEDLRQNKLASDLNISPQQISKILKGEQNLTLKTIGNLSDALGLELISFPPYKDTYIKFYEPNFDWENETNSTINWDKIESKISEDNNRKITQYIHQKIKNEHKLIIDA